jgi:cystinosin
MEDGEDHSGGISLPENGSLSILSVFWGAVVEEYGQTPSINWMQPTTWSFELICLPFSIACGVVVGLSTSGDKSLSSQYRPVSNVFNWIYFFSWTIGFYPQIYQNWSRKSTIGISSDKVLIDIFGYTCTTLFNVLIYFIPNESSHFVSLEVGHSTSIRRFDACLSCHELLLTFILAAQIAVYDGSSQRPSLVALLACGIVSAFLLIYGMFVVVNASDTGATLTAWLFFVSIMRIGVIFIRNFPQIALNYRRKSTVGWNITACLMGLTGWIARLLQLLFDRNDTNNWSNVTALVIMVVLITVSILCNAIFILQHFLWFAVRDIYHNLPPPDKDPLLSAMSSYREELSANSFNDNNDSGTLHTPNSKKSKPPPTFERSPTSYSFS